MIPIIFILSTFGYLGLLIFLDWDIWLSIGLIFLFIGFWLFIFWWDERKRKQVGKGKKEEKGE